MMPFCSIVFIILYLVTAPCVSTTIFQETHLFSFGFQRCHLGIIGSWDEETRHKGLLVEDFKGPRASYLTIDTWNFSNKNRLILRSHSAMSCVLLIFDLRMIVAKWSRSQYQREKVKVSVNGCKVTNHLWIFDGINYQPQHPFTMQRLVQPKTSAKRYATFWCKGKNDTKPRKKNLSLDPCATPPNSLRCYTVVVTILRLAPHPLATEHLQHVVVAHSVSPVLPASRSPQSPAGKTTQASSRKVKCSHPVPIPHYQNA